MNGEEEAAQVACPSVRSGAPQQCWSRWRRRQCTAVQKVEECRWKRRQYMQTGTQTRSPPSFPRSDTCILIIRLSKPHQHLQNELIPKYIGPLSKLCSSVAELSELNLCIATKIVFWICFVSELFSAYASSNLCEFFSHTFWHLFSDRNHGE